MSGRPKKKDQPQDERVTVRYPNGVKVDYKEPVARILVDRGSVRLVRGQLSNGEEPVTQE